MWIIRISPSCQLIDKGNIAKMGLFDGLHRARITWHKHIPKSIPTNSIYHKNEMGKPQKKDLPLLKNDIKKVKQFAGLYGWISPSLSHYCPFG